MEVTVASSLQCRPLVSVLRYSDLVDLDRPRAQELENLKCLISVPGDSNEMTLRLFFGNVDLR